MMIMRIRLYSRRASHQASRRHTPSLKSRHSTSSKMPILRRGSQSRVQKTLRIQETLRIRESLVCSLPDTDTYIESIIFKPNPAACRNRRKRQLHAMNAFKATARVVFEKEDSERIIERTIKAVVVAAAAEAREAYGGGGDTDIDYDDYDTGQPLPQITVVRGKTLPGDTINYTPPDAYKLIDGCENSMVFLKSAHEADTAWQELLKLLDPERWRPKFDRVLKRAYMASQESHARFEEFQYQPSPIWIQSQLLMKLVIHNFVADERAAKRYMKVDMSAMNDYLQTVLDRINQFQNEIAKADRRTGVIRRFRQGVHARFRDHLIIRDAVYLSIVDSVRGMIQVIRRAQYNLQRMKRYQQVGLVHQVVALLDKATEVVEVAMRALGDSGQQEDIERLRKSCHNLGSVLVAGF